MPDVPTRQRIPVRRRHDLPVQEAGDKAQAFSARLEAQRARADFKALLERGAMDDPMSGRA